MNHKYWCDAVEKGQHVQLNYANDLGVHARGHVIAYRDRPTILIKTATGQRISWIADLVQPDPSVPDQPGGAPTTWEPTDSNLVASEVIAAPTEQDVHAIVRQRHAVMDGILQLVPDDAVPDPANAEPTILTALMFLVAQMPSRLSVTAMLNDLAARIEKLPTREEAELEAFKAKLHRKPGE